MKDFMITNKDTFEMYPRNLSRVDEEDSDARLTNVLYRDFLNTSARLTLKEKWDRDNPRMSTVDGVVRLLGLFCIITIATMMAVYICYFAFRREEAVQSLWLKTCLAWFALDIFFVCPFHVLYSEVIIPLQLSSEINEIRETLIQILAKAETPSASSMQGRQKRKFNSIIFMFASYRISQWRMQSSEIASKISNLSSQAPGHLILKYIKSKLNNDAKEYEDFWNFVPIRGSFGIVARFRQLVSVFGGWYRIFMEKCKLTIPISLRRSIEEGFALSVGVSLFYLHLKVAQVSVIWIAIMYSIIVTICLVTLLYMQCNSSRENQILPEIDDTPSQRGVQAFNHVLDRLYAVDSTDSEEDRRRDIDSHKSTKLTYGDDGDSDENKSNDLYDVSFSDDEMVETSLGLLDKILNTENSSEFYSQHQTDAIDALIRQVDGQMHMEISSPQVMSEPYGSPRASEHPDRSVSKTTSRGIDGNDENKQRIRTGRARESLTRKAANYTPKWRGSGTVNHRRLGLERTESVGIEGSRSRSRSRSRSSRG